ncbi:hypothetical protein EXE41_18725, partial [Halorubrum sp. SD690R]|uniref:hypothetical protein n=1 Tax=Halorubrum sp. SD690R TaxID=2518117 RepID=UPI0010F5A092
MQETYLSESLAEYGLGTWVTQEEVRVYDESEDDVAFVEPANGWFFGVNFFVYNAGGEELSERRTEDFSLYIDGTEYDPITDLPSDEFAFEDVREYFDAAIAPDYVGSTETIRPDSFGFIGGIFDIDTDPTEWAINVTGALETEPDQDQ